MTVEDYQNGELTSLTQGYGTTSTATTAYSYADPPPLEADLGR